MAAKHSGAGPRKRQKKVEVKKKKDQQAPASESSESDSEYEVDFIEGHQMKKDGKIKFFVRWKNYPPEDNTWETFDYFAHDAPELAQRYISRVFNAFRVP